MKRKTLATLCSIFMAGALALQGCQASPEEDIIVNKNDGTLEKAIQKESEADTENSTDAGEDASGEASEPEKEEKTIVEENFSDSFTCDSDGITVNVDATVTSIQGAFPVVRVKPHEITPDEVKLWADVLFEGKTAYEPGKLTKAELEERILSCKQVLNDSSAMSELTGGNEADVQIYTDVYNNLLASYEKAYETAEEQDTKKECEWIFHPTDYYEEILFEGPEGASMNKTKVLKTVDDSQDGHIRTIYAANRSESDFRLNSMNFYYEDTVDRTSYPGEKITMEEASKLTDTLVAKLGMDNWKIEKISDRSELAALSGQECSWYTIWYTPSYEEIDVISSERMDMKSEDLYAPNYYYSSLKIDIRNNWIQSVDLFSPLDTVKIENDNVEVLSFEKAYENFKTHMQTKYTKSSVLDPESPDSQDASVELKVTGAKQGLFRIKEKNNQDEFLMVPAWVFRGNILVDGNDWVGETDFAVVNGLDGSIINTSLGY